MRDDEPAFEDETYRLRDKESAPAARPASPRWLGDASKAKQKELEQEIEEEADFRRRAQARRKVQASVSPGVLAATGLVLLGIVILLIGEKRGIVYGVPLIMVGSIKLIIALSGYEE